MSPALNRPLRELSDLPVWRWTIEWRGAWGEWDSVSVEATTEAEALRKGADDGCIGNYVGLLIATRRERIERRKAA